MREAHTVELLYLQHFPDLIRMLSQKVCTGERMEIWSIGLFRICRSIRQMWEEITMRMLSVSTASPEKAA